MFSLHLMVFKPIFVNKNTKHRPKHTNYTFSYVELVITRKIQTMQKILNYMSFLGILFLAQACQPPKDVTIEKGQMEIALPLFHAEMSIADMLKNTKDSSAVKVYNDNKISLIYSGELVKRTSEDILGTIPESKFPILLPMLDFPVTLLNDGDVQINEANIKSGFIHYKFTNNTVQEDVTVNLTLVQLVNGGQAFTTQVVIPYTSNLPASLEDSIDLSGYNLDLSSGVLSLHYTAVSQSGVSLELFPGTDLEDPDSYVQLKDVVFEYVEGHWDKVDHDFEEQTIEIDFFENNFVNGEIYFDDPKVDFTILSSFGLPVRTKLNYFRIVEKDSSTVDMVSQLLADGIDFNYPKLNPYEVGQSKKTTFSFHKGNSNIAEVLNTNPVRIEYDIDVTINPDNLSNSVGFATDSSNFTMLARAELPLIGKVNQFLTEKEFDIDFSDQDATEAVLKIASDNEVPLSVSIQLYFLDNNGSVLDSLNNDDYAVILDAADFPGPSIKHVENEFQIDNNKWNRIKEAKKIRVKGNYTSSSDGQQIVTFLADQQTNLKVGLKLKF